MKRLRIGLLVAAVLGSVTVLAQTNLFQLRGRSDANGYLLLASGQYTAPPSNLTVLANLRGKTDANGYLLVAFPGGLSNIAVGAGTQTGSPVLSIFTSTTAASNVGTAETDLITYAMPANTLSADGKGLRIRAWGTLANDANTKTVRVYFGASVVETYAGTNGNTGWYSDSTVLRTGATAQISVGWQTQNVVSGGIRGLTTASPTETLSGAVTIKVTGQSGAASNDVTVLALIIEALP